MLGKNACDEINIFIRSWWGRAVNRHHVVAVAYTLNIPKDIACHVTRPALGETRHYEKEARLLEVRFAEQAPNVRSQQRCYVGRVTVIVKSGEATIHHETRIARQLSLLGVLRRSPWGPKKTCPLARQNADFPGAQ